jgi:allantoin racemase
MHSGLSADNRGGGKRLWIQSGADLTRHEGYADVLRQRAQSIVGPDVELRVEGMPPGLYAPGASGHQTFTEWTLTHHYGAVYIADCAVRAEREGFDGFIIPSFTDHGVALARAAANIPVTGFTEAALAVSRAFADSVVFVSPHPGQARFLRRLLDSYGAPQQRVVTLSPPLVPFEISAGDVPRERIVAAFEATVRAIEPSEFEAVIPAETFLSLILGTEPVLPTDSAVPVLDGFAMGFAFVQALMTLGSIPTMQTSRAGRYAHVDYARASHVYRVISDGLAAGAVSGV